MPVIFLKQKIKKLPEKLIKHDVKIASFYDEGFAKFMRSYDINENMFCRSSSISDTSYGTS